MARRAARTTPPGQGAKAAEASTWAGCTRALHRRSPGVGAATGLAIPAAASSGPPGAAHRGLGMPGRMVAVTGQSPSPDAPQSLSVLEAVLERITYANEETGYTVARVATERTGAAIC